MGKRCDCGFVMEMFDSDPRLACLPLAVRALWLVLVRRMQQLGQSVLVFGSEIPKPNEVAMMVAVSETELETHLAPLLARGLLVRGEDGAIGCPMLAARQSRSDINRANGLRGGRPRKDGSPARQRTMVLPIAGGLGAESQITDAKPNAAGSVLPAKLSSSKLEEAEASKPRVVTPEEVERVGFAAAEAAGLDPARGGWTIGVVRGWLEAGADDGLVLGVIGQVMGRANRPQPQGLGYFDRAMKAAIAVRPVAEPVKVANPGDEDAEAYLARVAVYEASGRMGPAPVRRYAA